MPTLLYLYVEWLSLNAKLLTTPVSWNSIQQLKLMDTTWENDNIKEKASKKKLIVLYLGHIKPDAFKVDIF